jgi:hypothetical protein
MLVQKHMVYPFRPETAKNGGVHCTAPAFNGYLQARDSHAYNLSITDCLKPYSEHANEK